MRALVGRAVRAAGHEVVAEFSDAESALAELADLTPDVLFVDSRVPPGGILDLIPRLRAVVPTMKLYILASLGERALVRSAIAAGANGACLRPIRESVVGEILATGG